MLLGASHTLAGECRVERVAELPVTMQRGHPLVPVTLEGRQERLIADSGAFYSVLTPATAQGLKLRETFQYGGLRVKGVNGEATVSVATVRAFGIAGVTIPRVEFLVGGSSLEDDVAGVLGQNVLGIADVEYDLAAGVLRLWKPRDCPHPINAYWAKSDEFYGLLPIRPPDAVTRHTVGVIMINGVKVNAAFDTGAPTSVLSLPGARRAHIDLTGSGVTDGGPEGGFGRELVATRIAPVASVEIGGETIKNTRLRVGGAAFGEAEMLVGADFFLSHRVYVSNMQHRMLFTYNGGPVFDFSAKPPASTLMAQGAAGGANPQAADADGMARLGAADLSRNDLSGAIEALTRAHALAPSQPDYLYRRAVAYLRAAEVGKADADLELALELRPDFPEARLARAGRRLDGAQTDAALADLAVVDAILAKSSDLRPQLGALYEHADRFEDAVRQYDLWLASHPDDFRRAMMLNARCWSRALSGNDLPLALADCGQALRLAPAQPSILDSRGLVLLRLGRYGEAIAAYDAVLAKRPKTAWSLLGRGIAKTRMGQSAGKADLDAAAQIDPKLPRRAKALGIAP